MLRKTKINDFPCIIHINDMQVAWQLGKDGQRVVGSGLRGEGGMAQKGVNIFGGYD